MKGVQIESVDGTMLSADVHLPIPTSPGEKFPLVIFSNSWACPELEYIIESIKLAEQGYVVLEYESRGWFPSGGYIEAAGPLDQRDTSEVISFCLARQEDWHVDDTKIALAGISYGGGLALLGAARDPRVTTAVSMSGWATMERSLFNNDTPNLVWGTILMLSGRLIGRMDPALEQIWKQVLIGNESYFHNYSVERSAETYLDSLRERNVPLLFSSNLEDRLFEPQFIFDFFQGYPGPKKILLNQGIHATAEIGGLLDLPQNYVWAEVTKWLDHWLKGVPMDQPQPLVDMQLRSDKRVRERFMGWPDSRVVPLRYTAGPRGRFGVHGALLPPPDAGAPHADAAATSTSGETEEEDSITFSRHTGITAGIPIIGEILQVYMDRRITSNLLLASRAHAIWYYAPVSRQMRLCGTPQLDLDFTSNSGKWQVVAYLFYVNGLFDQGTLISHGVVSCWNCTAGERITRQIELRTLCEDVTGGLAVAFNLYSDLYEPANAASDLQVNFRYSQNFALTVPVVLTGSESTSLASETVVV